MSVPSVLQAVEAAGRDAPHRPSLLFSGPGGTQQFSAGDLSAAMTAWARGLHPMRPTGSAPGASVAVVVAPRGFDAYAVLLGAMRAGMAGCILPGPNAKQEPSAYWTSHREVLARIGPAAVVAPAALAEPLRSALPPGTPLVNVAAPPPSGASPFPTLAEVDGDGVPAILQHSSGTTGLKKGVVLTYGQVRAQVAAYSAALGMTAADAVASWLPLYHDMGLVTALLLPLSIGSMVVSMDPFDWLARPASILEEAARHRASFLWLPNFAFAHLTATAVDGGPYDLSAVRSVVDCSEPCRASTLAAFAAAFAPHGLASGALSACYAMAETVFAVTQSPVGRPPRVLHVDGETLAAHGVAVPVAPGVLGAVALVSCGPPIGGTSVRVVPPAAAQQRLLAGLFRGRGSKRPAGEPIGEILVRSNSAFVGYHGDPGQSPLSGDGWYCTGDLGFMHGGELHVTGRIKDLIIVNGRNFYAHDVETAAGGVEGVKAGRAAAFGVDRDATGSQAVVVVVESAELAPTARAAIARGVRDAVQQALGLVLHDVLVRAPGVLVKTTSGKVSREANRNLYVEEATA